ncbi:hypothetical protein TSUD_08460 [Trifolium subterraneum]|nr:hypothetical protein TSUD_08460 [Trifolium subterraneum]
MGYGQELLRLVIGWLVPATLQHADLVTNEGEWNWEGAIAKRKIGGSDGEWLGGFAEYVGQCSAFVIELWGVYEGLKYVKNMGLAAVEFNVDSLAMVEALKRKTNSNVTGGALINRIRPLTDLDWEVNVQHTC